MANSEHMRILSSGKDQWNLWRDRSPLVTPDLSTADLSDRDLSGLNLKYTNLQSCNLERVELRNARLSSANLQRCFLSGAILEDADLSSSDLQNVQARGVNFDRAILDKAICVRSDFEGSTFIGASLRDANIRFASLDLSDFTRADFEGADIDDSTLRNAVLDEASMRGTDLRFSDLTGASLNGTILENADMRGVRSLIVDETMVRGAKFSPRAGDGWSVLRRSYTGPMFLFHLLFLIAYLVPYIGKSIFWIGVNKAQLVYVESVEKASDLAEAAIVLDEKAIADINGKLAEIWERRQLPVGSFVAVETAVLQSPISERGKVIDRAVGWVKELGPCLTGNCRPKLPVIFVLLGAGKGWFRILLAALLLIYNFGRAIFTRQVSLLRDAEERSGFSPRREDYQWIFLLHRYCMQFLFWIAVVTLALHGYDFLFVQVSLPE